MASAVPWIPDTTFGRWFLSTDIWLRYVLSPAVDELRALHGTQPAQFNCLMDVGCGQGMALPLLTDRFRPRRLLAVDIDQRLTTLAEQTAATLPCPAQVLLGSVHSLDLPANSVDGIFCHQLLHHIPEQERAMRELYRVLEPGGYLFVSESCQPFIESWTVRWLFRHPPYVQRTSRGFVQLARNAGFELDECRIREHAPWWSLRDLGLLRRLGWRRTEPEPTEVLFVARKPRSIPNG